MQRGYGEGTIAKRLTYRKHPNKSGEFELEEGDVTRVREPKLGDSGFQIGCLWVSYQAFDKLVELRKEHRGN